MTLKDFKEKILYKEMKVLVVLILYVFITILIYYCTNNYTDFEKILANDFLDKASIFSSHMFLSIGITGIILAFIKLVFNKNERYYLVSTTFLDRVASICIGSLGVIIPVFIFLFVNYSKLENGEFARNISYFQLGILLLIYFSWVFGADIICKYFSEEIKEARKNNKDIGKYSSSIFALMYSVFFLLPAFLVPLLK
ncbi:hypothetical protein MIS45_10410 [Wielerella bovis]|uniref:hypothetical protein n=1 Tax=Wielerella bovis TaxID=2917790 RepID=UPI00201921B2|nr:hypothetical protein [Wielerella bovis]ULJ69145.1 hypothetical protein MIS45_10410 [Wielerella bovis]